MRPITISSAGGPVLAAMRKHQLDMASAMERLATGKKINRASDGPADVVAIEHLKGDSERLAEEIRLLERENLELAAEEGAKSVLSDLLMEMRGLTVAAANTGGLSDAEREAMQLEADSILKTISFLAGSATYGGERILDGHDPENMGQVSVDDGQGGEVAYSLADLGRGRALNLIDGDIGLAEQVARGAEQGMSASRGSIGATMAGNESRIRAMMSEYEGTEAVRSLLEDTDYAAEVARLVRSQTLQRASLFAAGMSQHQSGTVLRLLEGVGGRGPALGRTV